MANVNFILDSEGEARVYRDGRGDCTAMPVEGGYMVLEWSDYYRRIQDEAQSLFIDGWRSTDDDIIHALINKYCMDDNVITREWAGDIMSALHDIEGYMWRYE